MVKHLEIYRGENEPEDRNSFLWLHTNSEGKRVLEEYNGASWQPVSTGFSEIQAEIGNLEELITENKNNLVGAVNETVEKVGALQELTTEDKSSLVNAINEVADNAGGGIISTTYADLKALRDNAQLVPGAQYRITDYHTTTAEENTLSADHQFDIIVTADDERTLNENARAINSNTVVQKIFGTVYSTRSEGGIIPLIRYPEFDDCEGIVEVGMGYRFAWGVDPEDPRTSELDNQWFELVYSKTKNVFVGDPLFSAILTEGTVTEATASIEPNSYFANSNLAAWELKYCLDNDTDRFAWASDSQLLSLAYTDIDDNTYYARRDDVQDTTEDGINYYCFMYVQKITESESQVIMLYTDTLDISISSTLYRRNYSAGGAMEIDSGSISAVIFAENGSGVIYYMKDEFSNECCYDFKNIQYIRPITEGEYDPENGEDTWVYTFNVADTEDSYSSNDLSLDGVYFGAADSNIIRGCIERGRHYLNDNVFLNYGSKDGNTLCYSNTLNDWCQDNTFGDSVGYIHLGKSIKNSFIGSDGYGVTIGDDCDIIIIGDYSCFVSLDRGCSCITMQDYSVGIEVGSQCHDITINIDNSYQNDKKSSIIVGSCCEHLNIFEEYPGTRVGISAFINPFTRGTSSSIKDIFLERTIGYDSYYSHYYLNSSGNLTHWDEGTII